LSGRGGGEKNFYPLKLKRKNRAAPKLKIT